VHVLAGENGAGKSTLIRILAGVYDAYSGEIVVGGRRRRLTNPHNALRAGIATIHQELSLVPSMSVVDNLFLGGELPRRLGLVDFVAQESHATRILAEMALDISPRHLEFLFAKILELKGRGRGIVYITHKMEEIYRLADRITVLRDGAVATTAAAEDLAPDELVRLMVGRELSTADAVPDGRSDVPALEVESLRVAHPTLRGRLVVDGVTFTLRKGEVLGLAGLQGSGTSDVLHAVFGALGDRASGRARLCGEPFPLRTPRASITRGVVLLTNDRKVSGLLPERSVTENISLASLSRIAGPLGWMRRRAERDGVVQVTDSFRVTAPTLSAPVRTLSGGNQQKVYLARCLLPRPRILLLDEPTRGIDVGAKADIYALIRDWVGQGISILLITSEMEELLALSDRILVMHRGQIAAELLRSEASKEGVLAAAMGQPVPSAGAA